MNENNAFPYPRLVEVELDVIRFQVSHFLSERGLHFAANNCEVSSHTTEIARNLAIQLSGNLIAGKVYEWPRETVRVPEDWWQAARERWLPNWWIRRWPVKYRTITVRWEVRHICPHVNIVAHDAHIRWLMSEVKP